MPNLSDQQIADLAYNAGFRGEALRWAVAIAKAESGGNPSAYNPEAAAGTAPNAGSRGLWQIYGTAHPQYNSSIAFDPAVNARAAFEVYREVGNRFTPWSTFNNGMASQYVNALKIKQPTKTTSTGSGQQSTPIGAIQNTVQNVQSNVQALFFDKGLMIAGIVLILVGLFVIFQKPATQIVQTGAELALAAAL